MSNFSAYTEIQKLAGWIRTDKNSKFIPMSVANIKALDYQEDLKLFETRSAVPVREYIEQ